MSHGRPPATPEEGLRMSLRLVNRKARYYAMRCTALEDALKQIASMPTSERNPDGEEQAAHSMQVVARDALSHQ